MGLPDRSLRVSGPRVNDAHPDAVDQTDGHRLANRWERGDLCDAVDATIEALQSGGAFAKLQAAWPGTGTAI